jgi:hypothetical protein
VRPERQDVSGDICYVLRTERNVRQEVLISLATTFHNVSKAKNMHTDERVKNIRSKVRAEMALLAKLENELTDLQMKQLLKPAWNTLRDVKNYFLDEKVLKRPRTATVLAIWLAQAEASLEFAVQRRKFVENIIEEFGSGVRAVSA